MRRRRTQSKESHIKETPAERAFTRFAHAAGAYLKSMGWNAVVVGPTQIERFPLDPKFKYRLVLYFMGGPKRDNAD